MRTRTLFGALSAAVLLSTIAFVASPSAAETVVARTLSGSLVGSDGQPVATSGVVACEGEVTQFPCSNTTWMSTQVGNDGTYSLQLETTKTYTVAAFYPSGGSLAVHGVTTVSPGTEPVIINFTLPVEGGAARTRQITGLVLGSEDEVLGAGAGASICPGTTWTLGCAGGFTTGADQETGSILAYVEPNKEYRILPFGYAGSVAGSVVTIAAGDQSLALGVLRVPTAGLREVSGQILQGDGQLIPYHPNATAVWICPAQNGSAGHCKDRITVFADESGRFRTALPGDREYNLQAVSYAVLSFVDHPAGVRSTPRQIKPGDGPAAHKDLEIRLMHGIVSGEVSRTGWTSYPANTIGVGACPKGEGVPQTGTGENCFGLQVAFARPDGSYALALPPGTYGVSGFMFVDGALVIGTPRDIEITGDGDHKGDEDFSADAVGAVSSDTGTLVLEPPGDGLGRITVDAGGRAITNAVALAAGQFIDDPAPESAWGALSFTVQVDPPQVIDGQLVGETIAVRLRFERPIPEGSTFHKLTLGSSGGPATWQPFSGFDASETDPYEATLTLTDGGAGDYDGVANGFITDPVYAQVSAQRFVTTGFTKPITGGLNRVRPGQSLPAKWQVRTLDGQPVDDPGSFRSLVLACGSATVSSPASRLVSLGAGRWQLDLSVPKATAACTGTLTLTLADDTTLTAAVAVR